MKNKAFTIIELFVAIAILAILASMIIPMFTNIDKIKQKNEQIQYKKNNSKLNIGDLIVIKSLNLTGFVSNLDFSKSLPVYITYKDNSGNINETQVIEQLVEKQ